MPARATELWELSGSHWTLPIFVEVQDETARVTVPDIPLLRSQRAVLESALSQLATGGTEAERVIPMLVLRENAQKSSHPDAESVVVWNRLPSATVNMPNEEGVDEFVADWLNATGFNLSKASGTTIFVSLCTHMVHWLVNRRKPVNLMFAVLNPFQYRRNWKEILLGMAWTRAQEGTLENRDIYISSHPPSPADFVQSELLSYEKEVCNWTIECTPTDWFHRHSNQVEFKRRQRLGARPYLVSVCRTVMAHYERAASVYKTFVDEQNAKIVAIPEFNVGSSGHLGQVKAYAKATAKPPFRAFVLPAELVARTQPCDAQDSGTEIGALP
jgi:hypothetical protein